ncbi:MAG: hypothetical protein RIT04_674 [Candidatus Parcubacteria bacterium]|jgi:hypothetical protein
MDKLQETFAALLKRHSISSDDQRFDGLSLLGKIAKLGELVRL